MSLRSPFAALVAASALFASNHAFAWQTEIRGGAGLGAFQDIQVPVNVGAHQRGDGTVAEDENQSHTGFPLMAGIGFENRVTSQLRWEVLGIDGLQMRASSGPSATQSSSYSRLDLGSGMAYSFPMGTMKGALGGRIGVRRSSWSNVSSGHYINAALVGASAGIDGASGFGLQLYGNFAPVAHVGYSNAPVLGGSDFKNSSAALAEMGLRVSIPMRENVWFDTGIAQESAHMAINDITEYNHFGLTVDDTANPTRTYDLVTTVVKIGIRKAF